MGTTKADPYREHQAEYVATEEPRLVKTSPAKYVTITGESEPGGEDFHHRVKVLYRAAQTILEAKRQAGHDFKLGKLEAMWWHKSRDKETDQPSWHWKLLLRVPEFVTENDLVLAKNKARDPLVRDVWLELIDEGEVVQVLHVGPYEREQETVDKMREYARNQGKRFEGFHHEIYLTNPADVPPEKLRTIMRHQVEPAPIAP
ncbi:MAG: GyrI-like domain-containing protein [Myxococcales bacterium]|jgi:hypothetical protein